MKEQVVIVDELDNQIQTMEKLKAHELGLLHRAISVFLFNSKGEMLIHQRSKEKYHSPLKWTNACCSHPRENESYQNAAERRIFEELGIHTPLKEIFYFIYKSDVGGGLIEHELDHVFIGEYDEEVPFNPSEVQAIRWISTEDLLNEIQSQPEKFTPWFKIILNQYLEQIKTS